MAGETKSLGKKDLLDKFYTKSSIVDQCLALVDISSYDLIIEPSAGNGAFSNKIACKAYDIDPESPNIMVADWLKLDKKQFNEANRVLVVGNPPFGSQGALAVQFFNESATFCNTIAFILPLSFKKISVQNRLNLSFHLVEELILSVDAFTLSGEDYSAPCVFQVWKKQLIPREKIKLRTTTPLFTFCSPAEADLRIQRVGGRAGKASLDLTKSPSSNYFLMNHTGQSNEDIVELVNSITFPSIEFTVGPKSLPKGEMIYEIEKRIE